MKFELAYKVPARVSRNRNILKHQYGSNRQHQFRAANLLTLIWWTNCIIVLLLITFICLPAGFLDPRIKAPFSVALVLTGAAFYMCYKLVLNNNFIAARRIVLTGALMAAGFATLVTGGFPHTSSTPLLLIPIVLSFCTFGGRVSYISTAGIIAFTFSQYGLSQIFGVSFPDLAVDSKPGLNSFLVLTTTFTMVIIAMISMDISTKKYIEKSQRAAQSKSNFLANMSHEIRTPMNGVIGLTDVMLKTELNTQQQKYMDAIRVSGKSLLTIINDILDFSKIESGHVEVKTETYNLRKTLEDAVALKATSAESKGVRLHLFHPDDCPDIAIGDSDKLRQIVLNLIDNAIKFTHDGYVAVRVTAIQGSKSTRLRVEIQDTGIGISKDRRIQVFNRFTQAESSTTKRYGGTGLGLAITQRLVELMNGEIGVESELGEGSTFWIEIETEFSSQSEAENLSSTPQDRKVLFVTSHPEICQNVFVSLHKEHSEVYTAPLSPATIAFINHRDFHQQWNSAIYIDDVTDSVIANDFLNALRATAPALPLDLIAISSFKRAA